MSDTELARTIREAVRRGDLNQASFAFTVDSVYWQHSEDVPTRIVRYSVRDLFDVSVATFPAYQATEVKARSSMVSASKRGGQARKRQRLLKLAAAVPFEMRAEILKAARAHTA